MLKLLCLHYFALTHMNPTGLRKNNLNDPLNALYYIHGSIRPSQPLLIHLYDDTPDMTTARK